MINYGQNKKKTANNRQNTINHDDGWGLKYGYHKTNKCEKLSHIYNFF